ncbi:beta-defensin 12-like [Vombatus ursinus]|uniref:beta-defensin 12-like n=1 Tax=Vombatus ursinus TaxID=29139 RepID=UPI000FFD325A|nr:beta-defensin 12-like [Vombatus ursinus]
MCFLRLHFIKHHHSKPLLPTTNIKEGTLCFYPRDLSLVFICCADSSPPQGPSSAMWRILFLFFAIIYVLIQIPPGCKAGLEEYQLDTGGELKICATCRLGRGKCRRKCKSDETVAGSCKQSMLCCRKRIP